ncbi:MAG: hypothetical protein AAGE01_10330 [Pseudomonadota bacterium]
MARYTGKNCDLTAGGNSIEALKSVTINEAAPLLEDVAMRDSAVTMDSDVVRNSGSCVFSEDPADTTGQGALTPGASVAMVLYPEGNTTGKPSRTFTAIITEVSQPIVRDGYPQITVNFGINGPITDGTVA